MKKRLAAALALIVALSQPCAFAAQTAVEREEGVVAEIYDNEYIRAAEEKEERTEHVEKMHDAEIELAAEDDNVELFAETYGDFKYRVNTDDTVTIAGYNGTDTNITIPSEINGKAVTQIGSHAFWSCSSLTSVTIPDSVTEIGSSAFSNCSSLTSVTIPDSVTQIGRYALDNTALYYDENNWENGVLYIGNHLIKAKTDISGEYVIKDGTVTIADSAFYDCSSLTGIKIPDSVTYIGSNAFSDCSSLTSVTIPDSVTEIGDYAFSFCKSLTSFAVSENNANYASKDRVLFNKDMTELMYYPASNSGTAYTIPDSVTQIGNSAFGYCSSLTSIEIPDSVTYIGNSAFWYCSSLTSITISDSVTYIGNSAFAHCESITSFTVSENNANYTSKDGVLFDKDMTELMCYPASNSRTTYTIPDGVTQISGCAFNSCYSLTSIEIPNSVTEIDYSAFWYCSSLTSIEIPDSVIYIGVSAFWYCKSMTSFTVSENNANYTSKDGVLFNKDMTELMCYPASNSRTAYTIPDSVTEIDGVAFSYCSSLTGIEIPNSVTQIDNNAFSSCSSLTSVTIPDSVTQIGDRAFSFCKSLASFAVSENNANYTSKDGVLFNKDMTELIQYPIGNSRTAYTIPNSVTEIDDYAFRNCESVTSFTVSENNANYTSKDGVLFNKDMTELMYYPIGNSKTTYTIPDGVTQIGGDAFYNCSNLTSIEIPDSVTEIGSITFWNCKSMTSFTVSENNANYASKDGVLFNKDMTELVQYPIGNSRTAYTIPDSVTYIDGYAFEYCSNLTSVEISDSVTQIGNYAFWNCDNLTVYGYPGSYAEKYAKANEIPFIGISSFAFNDVALTEPTASYADNKVTVDISVTNSNESSEKFTLYAVGYSANGAMVGIKAVSVTGNSYNDGIKFDTTEKPAYVKVFAIDAVNGASPLCVAQKTELN